MLSYQHAYHAGNFADVIKHIALTRLLHYLTQKDKPLFYLETHAGKGHYDLREKRAEKTGEYKQGIGQIWQDRNTLAPVFQDYIQAVKLCNEADSLRFYPGSPMLAIHALRAQDRAYLCELHSTEYEELNKLPHFYKKVHVSEVDGIASLAALLPPPEKRGLIFIDPSFEVKNEYKNIPSAIRQAMIRFPTGVYCLWYPLVNRLLTDQLTRKMKAIPVKNALQIEFHRGAAHSSDLKELGRHRPHETAQQRSAVLREGKNEVDNNSRTSKPMGMSGCGLWIINPPFTFASEMRLVLETLKKYFNPGLSSYTVENHSTL